MDVVFVGGIVWDCDDFGIGRVRGFAAGAGEDGELEGGVLREGFGDVVADVCASGSDDEDSAELSG